MPVAGMESDECREPKPAKECLYKTKLVEFLGRTTPIILQNDNGPCPLLAICNVLLLRNNLNLSPDTTEVSQEKLLSLVAERLIDSNSNVNNKDAGYVQNQQQNIADAIDLLPRLATGIDVNTKFRRIDDFEFTRECAIFDLLDIPLYHGWLVDAQDHDTAHAIGSKSYNALMGELVVLETRNFRDESTNKPEEDSIDFAAATTATLGVPSPSLSRGRSFDDSPCSNSDQQKPRKGDVEEEAEVLKVLQLSKDEAPTFLDDSLVIRTCEDGVLVSTYEGASDEKLVHLGVECQTGSANRSNLPAESFALDDCSASSNDTNDLKSFEITSNKVICPSSEISEGNVVDQLTGGSGDSLPCNNLVEEGAVTLLQKEKADPMLTEADNAYANENFKDAVVGKQQVQAESGSTVEIPGPSNIQCVCDTSRSSTFQGPNADSDTSGGRVGQVDEPATPSTVESSEPIYEGEECILDSGTAIPEDREPVYEGEVVLAEQADKCCKDDATLGTKNAISQQEGQLIRNFLRNNASQLTVYGLFCLQDGLKERELCVFFRNNHFSTMFKFDGELYLLATDQGYINQPDLVWEKLNEVNGDTLFMTGNFKEFKVESHVDGTWDEHNAMASTADYLSSMNHSVQAGSDMNSDLQLAIALQQQEFEQQPQRHMKQPSPTTGSSRLVTGPHHQVPKPSGRSSSSSTPAKHDSKKERCIVM